MENLLLYWLILHIMSEQQLVGTTWLGEQVSQLIRTFITCPAYWDRIPHFDRLHCRTDAFFIQDCEANVFNANQTAGYCCLCGKLSAQKVRSYQNADWSRTWGEQQQIKRKAVLTKTRKLFLTGWSWWKAILPVYSWLSHVSLHVVSSSHEQKNRWNGQKHWSCSTRAQNTAVLSWRAEWKVLKLDLSFDKTSHKHTDTQLQRYLPESSQWLIHTTTHS